MENINSIYTMIQDWVKWEMIGWCKVVHKDEISFCLSNNWSSEFQDGVGFFKDDKNWTPPFFSICPLTLLIELSYCV